MIKQKEFVDVVLRHVDALVQMQRDDFLAAGDDSTKAKIRRAYMLDAKGRLEMQLMAIYALAVAEGAEIGRAGVLAEQEEERAKKKRAAKRRSAKKRRSTSAFSRGGLAASGADSGTGARRRA